MKIWLPQYQEVQRSIEVTKWQKIKNCHGILYQEVILIPEQVEIIAS